MRIYFEVEKILDKRITRGKTKYLLRWIGWDSKYDSWEEDKNIECPELIYRFEDKLRRKSAAKERVKNEPKVEPLFAHGEPTGFDKGLQAEAITGVTKIGSEIIYFVKW